MPGSGDGGWIAAISDEIYASDDRKVLIYTGTGRSAKNWASYRLSILHADHVLRYVGITQHCRFECFHVIKCRSSEVFPISIIKKVYPGYVWESTVGVVSLANPLDIIKWKLTYGK